MIKLITASDIRQYRQLSKTPFDEKVNEIILDAQIQDIEPLLGDTLYNKILANVGDYTDLLNGCEYEYKGVSYTNYGLKMVLAYFAYARFMYYGDVMNTPTGPISAMKESTQPVSTENKKTSYTLNRQSAVKLWENVQNYLIRTENADYKSVHCKPTGNFRLTKII